MSKYIANYFLSLNIIAEFYKKISDEDSYFRWAWNR